MLVALSGFSNPSTNKTDCKVRFERLMKVAVNFQYPYYFVQQIKALRKCDRFSIFIICTLSILIVTLLYFSTAVGASVAIIILKVGDGSNYHVYAVGVELRITTKVMSKIPT